MTPTAYVPPPGVWVLSRTEKGVSYPRCAYKDKEAAVVALARIVVDNSMYFDGSSYALHWVEVVEP